MADPMTQDDKDLLERQRVNLIENVSVEDGMLFAHLRARGAITLREEEDIKAGRSRSHKVGLLLDILQKGNNDNMDKFIYSLRETRQSEWLRSPGQPDHWRQTESAGQEPKNTNTSCEDARDLLEKCRPELMKEVKLKDGLLLAELVGRKVITKEEEDFVKSKTGWANCVGQLTTFIIQRVPDALEQFKHSLNRTGQSHIVTRYLRPPTTVDMYSSTFFAIGGSSTDELTEALRENLREQLERKILLDQQLATYIDQPCAVERGFEQHEEVSRGSHRVRDQKKTALQLVEDSSPGDRIVVLGDAGMGKTTLLKHLAESWVDKTRAKLAEKFKFVFLIPMGLVGNISLLNIICDELALIPTSNSEQLQMSLDRNDRRLLFMLDSYEELREYVAKDERAGINNLITGRIFSKSTVIVTARPDTKLPQAEYQIKAQLKYLPVREVVEIIRQRVEESQESVTTDDNDDEDDDEAFFCKPINLALLLYVKEQGEQEKITSEAQLFSVWLQHIMLPYAKKKHLTKLTPKATRYVLHEDIPNDIRRLVREISKRCFEEMKIDCTALHIQDKNDMKDYLDLGLFTEDEDANSVTLEHPFFRELLAAVHLAEEPKAWTMLFEEIRRNFDRQSSRSSLFEAVHEMRLQNELIFLVAFKPKIVEDVASLFVIERGTIDGCDNYHLVDFEFYAHLLQNCSDEDWKKLLVARMVNASVRDVGELCDWGSESGSLALMQYLDRDQRITFLKKAYDLELCEQNGKSTISCAGDNKSIGICDRFVIALSNLHNCTFNTEKFSISGQCDKELELPAIMLSRNMTSVTQIALEHVTLCDQIPEYMRISDNEVAATSHPSSPLPTDNSLVKVELYEVQGLEHCDLITPHQCQLEMHYCSDVTAKTIKKCFPKLSLLELCHTVVICSADELTSWLSTVESVKRIGFALEHKGEEKSLCHLLDLFSGRKELASLLLSSFSLLFDVKNALDNVKMNNTLKELTLLDCGEVNVFRLLEFCTCCLKLKEKITVGTCQTQISENASFFGNVDKNNTLSELYLIDCEGNIDLRQLSEVCLQCLQLQKLTVEECQIKVGPTNRDEVGLLGDSLGQKSRLRELRLKYCEGDVNFCQLVDVYGKFPHMTEFYVKEVGKLIADDERVTSVSRMAALKRFILLRSPVQTTTGQTLSQDKMKQWLAQLCPLADIYFKLPPDASDDSDSSSFESSDSDEMFGDQISDQGPAAEFPSDAPDDKGQETDQGPAEQQDLQDIPADTTGKRTRQESGMLGEGDSHHTLQDGTPSKRPRTLSSSDICVEQSDELQQPKDAGQSHTESISETVQ